jgi:quercetin dioxygenase-like cupin family protein
LDEFMRYQPAFPATALVALSWKLGLFTLAVASAWAQGANQPPVFTPAGDRGVSRAVLIDRPEIRVLRVEVEPGAIRNLHKHDDVQYHLFVVIAGNMEVLIGTDAPAKAPEGATLFFKPGTSHGFRNIGTGKAAAVEIFVRQSSIKAKQDAGHALAEALSSIAE